MKKIALLALSLLMVVNTACSDGNTAQIIESTTSETTTTTEASNKENTENEGNYYPVTITNYNYTGEEIEITFNEAPTAVVAGYQGTIETMIALGLEEHLTMSFGLDNEVKPEWQAGFEKASYREDLRFTDKETIRVEEADLIFSWGSLFSDERLGDVSTWIENGTNTYISTNTRAGGHSRTLENEYNDILNIGKIFNVNEEAQILVDEMKNGIVDTLALVPENSQISVAMIEPYSDTFSNYHKDTLGGDMIIQLGGTMPLGDAKEIGKEDIVLANPEVIFVVYMAYDGENPEEVKQAQLDAFRNDPAFASLQAVQNDRLIPIMLGDMYASGPRTLDGIKTIAQGLYPDIQW